MSAIEVWRIIGLVVVAACGLGVLGLIARSVRSGVAYWKFRWIINFEPSRYDHPRILDPRDKVERSKSPIVFWFLIANYLFVGGVMVVACVEVLLGK